jgi:hypothetical protein
MAVGITMAMCKKECMFVVDTPFFLRKTAILLNEEERSELVVFLGMNPEKGDVVPETGGVHKVRRAAQGNVSAEAFPFTRRGTIRSKIKRSDYVCSSTPSWAGSIGGNPSF